MFKPRIVIVGGGAGGLELVARLSHVFGKNKKAFIHLVDASSTHTWKPLLHEVAAGTLESHENELSYFSYANEKHFYFHLGALKNLNRKDKKITLAPMMDDEQKEYLPERYLEYDILILSIGSMANNFSIAGVYEHCFFLDNRKQAEIFQQYLLRFLLKLSYLPPDCRQLKITIIGGGATGVELTAELHYAIHHLIGYGLKINPQEILFTLIESAERLLSALPRRISDIALNNLSALNVKVYTSERVIRVTAKGVQTHTDRFIPADILIWTAGIKAPDLLSTLDGLETNKLNQLIVKQTLQTTTDPAIFAFGDCAYCMQENNEAVPARAQAAHQQAIFLVRAINNYIENKPLPLYHYHDYGSLITISHYGAAGILKNKTINALFIEGKFARWAYLSLYKRYQIALYGLWRVLMLSIGSLLNRRKKPQLKLH